MVNGTDVVPDWLTLPDIVERTGATLQQVKRWLQDREVVGQRGGENNVLRVPAGFFVDDGPLPALRGTITVLADGGMSDEEIIAWLHAPDESWVGGSAIASLHGNAKTEVRRRAQEQAF